MKSKLVAPIIIAVIILVFIITMIIVFSTGKNYTEAEKAIALQKVIFDYTKSMNLPVTPVKSTILSDNSIKIEPPGQPPVILTDIKIKPVSNTLIMTSKGGNTTSEMVPPDIIKKFKNGELEIPDELKDLISQVK